LSPEQVEGDPAALDTRSDVYALGGSIGPRPDRCARRSPRPRGVGSMRAKPGHAWRRAKKKWRYRSPTCAGRPPSATRSTTLP
jgi:hypothetical protein